MSVVGVVGTIRKMEEAQSLQWGRGHKKVGIIRRFGIDPGQQGHGSRSLRPCTALDYGRTFMSSTSL